MRVAVRVGVVCLWVLAVVSVEGCDACAPPVVEPDPDERRCLRTEALDEPRSCVADDDCACGAHCSFNSCTFDCRANSDCSGGDVCDDFGRCSPSGQRVPPLAGVARPTIVVQPGVVAVTALDTPYAARFYVPAGETGALQLVARGGAVVWCPGADAPSDGCDVDGADSADVQFSVGLGSLPSNPDAPVVEAPVVEIRDEHGVLGRVGAFEGDTAPVAATPAPESDLMSGLYEGSALRGVGGGLLSPIALPGAENVAAALRSPIRATVSLDDTVSGVIVLEDPTGLALPVPSLVVAVNNRSVRWPALTWLTLEGSNVEVMTAADDVLMDAPDGGFALRVPLAVAGLQLPTRDAALGALELNLVKSAPLPSGFVPPAPTPSARPALAPDRGFDALAPGALSDGLATLAPGSVPTRQLTGGPWDNPKACVEELTVPARLASVSSTCSASASPNETQAPTVCPAALAGSAGGTEAIRFPCAYDIVAPRGLTPDPDTGTRSCSGLNVSTFIDVWDRCLDDLLAPLPCTSDVNCIRGGLCDVGAGVCRFGCQATDASPTGPSTECASGFCQDGLCTDNDQSQAAAFCGATICGRGQTEVFAHDFCVAAQAATGCVPVDIPLSARVTVPASLAALRNPGVFPVDPGNVEAGEFVVFPVSETATRECVVPAYEPDRDCTIAALCADTPASVAAARFGADIDTGDARRRGTGDPLCEDGGLSIALTGFREAGLDDNAEVPEIATCASDLSALTAVASSTGLTVSDLTDDTSCFSPGRLAAAFDVAARGVRAGRAPDRVALGFANRLTQEVAELQSVVARNALDQYRRRITFDGNDDPRAALAELEDSLSAWGFLLDPRVSGVLLEIPTALLQDPDPRVGFVIDPDASEGITQSVAISLVQALTDQLALLDFALERAWLDGAQSAIGDRRARIASLLRTGGVVLALADALHATASVGGPPPWEKGYQTVRLEYAQLVRRALDRAEAIDAGLNPLGIDDVDTPIFFPGDIDGDRDRFTAVSRFLIGTGPGDPRALAPIAIADAQDALAAARVAWRADASGLADSARRQDDIIRRYGELITGFCGAPIDDPDFDIGTYNVLDQPLDVETCFIEPRCRARPEAFTETLGAADLGFQICVTTRAGLAVGGLDNAALGAALARLRPAFSKAAIGAGAFPLTIVRLEQDVNLRTAVIRVGGEEVSIPLDDLGQIGATVSPAAFGAAAATNLQAVTNDCNATRQVTLRRRPATSPATCTLADDCKVGDKCAAGTCVNALAPDILDQVECYYDGAISEQALAVRSAGLEVEVARAELDEFVERYNVARGSCAILATGQAKQQQLLAAHNDTMNDLNIARTVAASVAHAAENARECAAAGAGVDTSTPWGGSIGGGIAAASCAAGAVTAAANIAVEALDNVMAQAERKHEEAALAAQNDTEQKICMNDALLELVGAKAQTLRIRQAQQAQAAAVINLRGQKSYTAGLWADGNAALEKERRIAEAAALGQFVLSDAAELYIDRFRYAQRLTYLAVRAIEYEFQAPQPLARDAVIGAANPDELEEALRTLAATLNNGTVDGSQPTGLLAVVSLREHLLQIADLSANIAGEQTLTSEERFRLLLTSPRFSVVDDNGDYLGQQIPFTLAPLGALGLGADTAGIPIVAQSDCAERLWAVNAAVVGGDDLFDGESSSFTRLDLLQRNTFSSQRCDDDGDANPLLTSTVRPSMNLLADYSAVPARQSPQASAVSDFARGLMQPYLNVTREEFEREDFSQGSTTQLAGRGLYGDYALFIPAAALSVGGGPGLKLDAVDDILLRLDYVAAAR